jgi:predicted metal-dependent hydrolase
VDPLLRGELMARLNRDAVAIADRFGLRYRVIEPEAPQVKRRYGVCFSDGTIRIRLAHAKTGAPLRYSSLVATLCHELAHLRHFNHGPRFRTFNQLLLEWARSCGIYRPQKPGGAQPEAASAAASEAPRHIEPPCQLPLFG